MRFQVDTGSERNLLPIKLYKSLTGDTNLCMLCMYVGKDILTVVSPPINHMKDQVSRLSLLGVNAISLLAVDIKKVES